jgi:uncharacterized membrane-anchored protein YhcB (DUF1043 family)
MSEKQTKPNWTVWAENSQIEKDKDGNGIDPVFGWKEFLLKNIAESYANILKHNNKSSRVYIVDNNKKTKKEVRYDHV